MVTVQGNKKTVSRVMLLWIFSFCLFHPLFAEQITVVAEMNEGIQEHQPIKGTISITHNKDQLVDKDSFLMANKKISVELAKEVRISPYDPLLLSIYNFTLSGQPQGLYALPAISVEVGNKRYQSIMSSYTVGSGKEVIPMVPKSSSSSTQAVSPTSPSQAAPQDSSTTSPQPVLRLEALNQGSSALYPGQRTTFVYRYYFSGDIGLTTEKLPLLDAEGFIKIGEKEIHDAVKGTESIREISQQVEAVKPGKYTFGPSLIEGRAYKEDVSGNPVFTSDKLSSTAPAIEINVMPFPQDNKPASFNGAVGSFSFKASLLSPSEITVGDEISLLLEISGEGNLKNISLSNLCCQPGFSGFFGLSDLPPFEEVEGSEKKITVKFRALNSLAKAIPSIEFSFFNPLTTSYSILHSSEIPISIKQSPSQIKDFEKEALSPVDEGKVQKNPDATAPSSDITSPPAPNTPPSSRVPLPPVEIESIFPLKTTDLYNKTLGNWWVLAIVPFGIMLLIYQSHLKEYLEWKKNYVPTFTGKQLFQQAFVEKDQGKCDFELLKKSFKLALAESGLIPSKDISDQEIPDEGLCREVKVFGVSLDEKRFAGQGSYDVKEIYRLAEDLMGKIL